MKHTLPGLFALLAAVGMAGTTELFNGYWNFRMGQQTPVYYKTAGVTLPHTWNTDPTAWPSVRGMGLYRKEFETRSTWAGRRVFLRFGAAGTVADVSLNGTHLTRHCGGYTAFTVELTDLLKPVGQKNRLSVRVSNAETSEVLPLDGDFVVYGGLTRKAELLTKPAVCISPLDHGSSGILVTQTELTDRVGKATVRVRISGAREPVPVTVEVAGKTFTAVGKDTVTVPIAIDSPRRWNGVADPFLYTARVTVGEDTETVSFGLRDIRFDPNKGLFLNGRRLRLFGVCKHAENEASGAAMSREEMELDLRIMREMGANAVRLAHYPHPQEMLDLCDRAGMLVWSEIPLVGGGGPSGGGYFRSDALDANAMSQLTEMIRQYGNHPSIFAWGLFNELLPNVADPLLERLHARARAEDPSRPTVAASAQDYRWHFSGISDIIAWNRYFGWYGGSPEDIGASLDETHKNRPQFCIGISEYGAGGSVRHHEEVVRKISPRSKFHPEAWQTEYHAIHWRELAKRDYLWGTFIWNMFDFAAAHRTEGEQDGINDKGMVTRDRKTRKDVFYLYQANWRSDIPVLHLCEKNFAKRLAPTVSVRAFSNVGPAELLVNGRSLGIAEPDSIRSLSWHGVPLVPGKNTVELRTPDKRHTDTCTWTL